MQAGIVFDHGFVDRLYLHSFPTRRSSDLSVRHPDLLSPRVIRQRLHFAELQRDLALGRAADRADRGNVEALAYDARSEEHTSELQSRENLVCRLLLEKNKKH